jgi:outer membrane protein assembly factor BamB
VVIALLSSLSLAASDWPRFRGPDGSGTSAETGLPLRWGDEEGLLWKTELPGAGSSSPIVSAKKVFVTCYSGYGARGERGSEEDLRRHVVAIDEASGKILWDRALEAKLPEEDYGPPGLTSHGYSSSTPVTDGERVYAFFGKSGVVAYDFEGKELWRAAVAADPRTHRFGTGSSPILVGGVLIVPASVECEAIVAFDKITGKELWRAPAEGYGGWWGTPVAVGAGGEKEVLVSVPDEIWSLNPENGKLRWYAQAIRDRAICPSLVASGGVAYAIGGRENGAVAVKIGGQGDVTASNVVWSKRVGSYVTSPVFHDGHLYWVTDRGIVHCVKAASGDNAYEPQRLGEGRVGVYASPVVADGKLYVVTRGSGTYVLEPKPEFKVLAHNVFASDESDFNASPAVSDGCLLLRSDRFLYRVGAKK